MHQLFWWRNAGETCCLKEDCRKLVFENDCLRDTVGVTHDHRNKMDYTRKEISITIKIAKWRKNNYANSAL